MLSHPVIAKRNNKLHKNILFIIKSFNGYFHSEIERSGFWVSLRVDRGSLDGITAPRFGRGAGIGREGIHVIRRGENTDVPEYLCLVHDVLGEPVFQIDILYFTLHILKYVYFYI